MCCFLFGRRKLWGHACRRIEYGAWNAANSRYGGIRWRDANRRRRAYLVDLIDVIWNDGRCKEQARVECPMRDRYRVFPERNNGSYRRPWRGD